MTGGREDEVWRYFELRELRGPARQKTRGKLLSNFQIMELKMAHKDEPRKIDDIIVFPNKKPGNITCGGAQREKLNSNQSCGILLAIELRVHSEMAEQEKESAYTTSEIEPERQTSPVETASKAAINIGINKGILEPRWSCTVYAKIPILD